MRLRGKTTIELTNINTGEVTTIEDTNMVTNALSELCQPVFKSQFTLQDVTARREQGLSAEALLRGLLLFDTVFDEFPNNLIPPVTASMIGHGCELTYAGVDSTLGSFNTSQSNTGSETERTYTWDFTAEQANGVIRSICLTTQTGGYIGHGVKVSMEETEAMMRPYSNMLKGALLVKNMDSILQVNKVPMYLSLAGDYLIQCDFQKIPTGILHFNKIHLESTKVNPFMKLPAHTLWTDETHQRSYVGEGYTTVEQVSVDVSSVLGTGSYFGTAQDGKYFYITNSTSTSESVSANAWLSGTKIKMVKIDLETFEFEEIEVTNTTGTTIALRTAFTSLAEGCHTFAVSNGYMYVRGWVANAGANAAPLYAINLADNTDAKQVTSADGSVNMVGISSATTSTPFLMTINGLPAFTTIQHRPNASPASGGAYSNVAVVKGFTKHFLGASIYSFNSTGSLMQGSAQMARSFPTDHKLYYGVENKPPTYSSPSLATSETLCYLAVNPNVLMTINNLSSPVEKTPAQTMRITYKLTRE